MKKLFVVLILLLFVTSAAGQNWFKGSLDDALTKAKNTDKPVLIDFYSST